MNVQKSSRWNSMAKEKVRLVGRDFGRHGDINRCGVFVELGGVEHAGSPAMLPKP